MLGLGLGSGLGLGLGLGLGHLDPGVEPDYVRVAQTLVVFHLAAQQLLRTRVDAVALDHLDRHLMPGHLRPG